MTSSRTEAMRPRSSEESPANFLRSSTSASVIPMFAITVRSEIGVSVLGMSLKNDTPGRTWVRCGPYLA